MRAKELVSLIRRHPFEGFRIYMSDGQAYNVLHPEMIAVSRTLVFIALSGKSSRGVEDWEDWIHCDPVHITRVGPLPKSKRASSRKRPAS